MHPVSESAVVPAFGWRLRGLLLAGIAALVVSSIAIHQRRFLVADTELVPSFSGDAEGWAQMGEGIAISPDGQATLRSEAGIEYVAISRYFDAPENIRHVFLTSEVQLRDVVRGEKNWHMGRIILASFDEDERTLYGYPFTLFESQGTRDWSRREAVFELRPDTAKLFLAIQLPMASGEIAVRDFSLRAARLAPWFPLARALAVASWVAFGAAFFSCYMMRQRHLIRRICAALLVVFGFLLVVFPGVNRPDRPILASGFHFTETNIAAVFPDATESKSQDSTAPSDGASPPAIKRAESVWNQFPFNPHRHGAHVAAFALLTLLGCCAAGRGRLTLFFLPMALIGEVIQGGQLGVMHPEDRTDILANVAGVGLGELAYLVGTLAWTAWIRRRGAQGL